jgi:deoxyadenosine/deoxycytidine kinase
LLRCTFEFPAGFASEQSLHSSSIFKGTSSSKMQSPDVSKPSNSGCLRKECNQMSQLPKNAPFACQDVRLRSRLYRTPAAETDRLCSIHFAEYNTLFRSDSSHVFHIEVDENTGCIDFVSNAKDDVSKIPERTLSIIECSHNNDCFEIVSATYKGKAIPLSELENVFPTGFTALGKRSRNFISGTYLEMSKLRDQFFGSEQVAKIVTAPLSVTDDDALPLPPFLISLEGNIGAGKSTLLSKLRELHPDWHFIDEPVDTWTSLKNDNGESLLEIFYADKKRWSYTFQNCALLSRFNLIEEAVKFNNTLVASGKKRKVFVTERCLDTDDKVFAKMLREDGSLCALEHELYQKWFDLLKQTATPLSAIVYVDTDPNTCLERIAKSCRSGEDGIPLEYLKALDKTQRAWIQTTDIPVLNLTAFPSAAAVGEFVDRLSTIVPSNEKNKENESPMARVINTPMSIEIPTRDVVLNSKDDNFTSRQPFSDINAQ